MKVEVIRCFYDLEKNEERMIGVPFSCSEKRAKYLEELGFVKIVETTKRKAKEGK